MSWEVDNTPPGSVSAVYYLVLPDEYVVLYNTELILNSSMTHNGDFNSFCSMRGIGTPLIPLDTHHALLLGWVDIDRMARNRPYLDDKIKAAIALVA